MEIPGYDVAADARAAQTSGYSRGYRADAWMNVVLEPGFRVWRGIGGRYSPFHVGPNTGDVALTGQPREEFWQNAQVLPGRSHGYRAAIAEYEIMIATPAAHALCSQSWKLGWGGAEQYFIPVDYVDNLAATGRRIHFR